MGRFREILWLQPRDDRRIGGPPDPYHEGDFTKWKEPPQSSVAHITRLPEGPNWEYELKLDGYRLQAIKDGEKVRLLSRRGNDFTRRFTRIATAVSKTKAGSLILDGEAVVVDNQGKPSFQMLQNRARLPSGWALVYYAFDLLHLNGADLKDRPLRDRRALLQKTLGTSGVRLSESLPGTLSQILQAVKAHGLEGVIAKRLDSKYQPDRRSDDWLKLPLKPSHNFVVDSEVIERTPEHILQVKFQWRPEGAVRNLYRSIRRPRPRLQLICTQSVTPVEKRHHEQ